MILHLLFMMVFGSAKSSLSQVEAPVGHKPQDTANNHEAPKKLSRRGSLDLPTNFESQFSADSNMSTQPSAVTQENQEANAASPHPTKPLQTPAKDLPFT